MPIHAHIYNQPRLLWHLTVAAAAICYRNCSPFAWRVLGQPNEAFYVPLSQLDPCSLPFPCPVQLPLSFLLPLPLPFLAVSLVLLLSQSTGTRHLAAFCASFFCLCGTANSYNECRRHCNCIEYPVIADNACGYTQEDIFWMKSIWDTNQLLLIKLLLL